MMLLFTFLSALFSVSIAQKSLFYLPLAEPGELPIVAENIGVDSAATRTTWLLHEAETAVGARPEYVVTVVAGAQDTFVTAVAQDEETTENVGVNCKIDAGIAVCIVKGAEATETITEAVRLLEVQVIPTGQSQVPTPANPPAAVTSDPPKPTTTKPSSSTITQPVVGCSLFALVATLISAFF